VGGAVGFDVLLTRSAGFVVALRLLAFASLVSFFFRASLLLLRGARSVAVLLALLLGLSGEAVVLDDSAAKANDENRREKNRNRPDLADSCHKSFDHCCHNALSGNAVRSCARLRKVANVKARIFSKTVPKA